MTRAVAVLLAAALLTPVGAAANKQTQSSPKRGDIPASADLQVARAKHKGTSLIHEIQTFGAWKPSQLTRSYGSEDGITFFLHIATEEPFYYVIGSGKYVLRATWAGGTKIRGVLHDNETNRDRVVTATHPDSHTIRWSMPARLLGKPYWWAAEVSTPDTSAGNDFTTWLLHPLG